jgi:hypothetical protein
MRIPTFLDAYQWEILRVSSPILRQFQAFSFMLLSTDLPQTLNTL